LLRESQVPAFKSKVFSLALEGYVLGLGFGLEGKVLVNIPDGISIGSAVFAQLTSERRQTCQGMPFPSKLRLPMGDVDPHLTRGSLGPADSVFQMASLLVQPFLHSSQLTVPILYSFQQGTWNPM